MVRPILEYGPSIWSPHTVSNSQAIGSVQRRVTRFLLNRYDRYDSHTERQQALGWPSLETRRLMNRLTFMYELDNNLMSVLDESRQSIHLALQEEFIPDNQTEMFILIH